MAGERSEGAAEPAVETPATVATAHAAREVAASDGRDDFSQAGAMTEEHDGQRARLEDAEDMDRVADRAHDEGQALFDALERRARRLQWRLRPPRPRPERILKLMD